MKLAQVVLYFSLATAALTVGGCARNTTSNQAAMTVTSDEQVDKRIIINHRGFNKKVSIGTLDVRRVGNMLQARVVIQNHKKRTIPFAYWFEWFDENGYPIDSLVGSWRKERLKGLDEKALVGAAASTRAVSVKLHIQQAKP